MAENELAESSSESDEIDGSDEGDLDVSREKPSISLQKMIEAFLNSIDGINVVG